MLHSIALSAQEDLISIAGVSDKLIKLTRRTSTEYEDIEDISGVTVELAVRVMIAESNILELKNDEIRFANPFLRACCVMRSVDEYNGSPLKKVLGAGGRHF